MFNGDTPLKMKKILKKCGFLIRQAINIRSLNNLPQTPRLMTWDKEKQEKIFNKAEKKIDKYVEYIIGDKKWTMRKDPLSRFIGWIQRIGSKTFEKRLKNYFKCDSILCNSCGLCVQYYPTSNISLNKL